MNVCFIQIAELALQIYHFLPYKKHYLAGMQNPEDIPKADFRTKYFFDFSKWFLSAIFKKKRNEKIWYHYPFTPHFQRLWRQ